MRLIKQKCDIDCGIAAAAIVSHRSYWFAHERDPNPKSNIGLSTDEMVELLKSITGNEWICTKMHYGKPLSSLKHEGKCVIVIRKAGRSYGHWVVLDKGIVYDPDKFLFPEPVAISQYKRNDWLVIRIVKRSDGHP